MLNNLFIIIFHKFWKSVLNKIKWLIIKMSDRKLKKSWWRDDEQLLEF